MKKTEQKVFKFIDENELLKTGDKVLIALSGGPDSVFLLHLLHKYKKRFKIELGAFHLNHKIRGKDADRDALFCEKLCRNLKIDYYSSAHDVIKDASTRKISIEEAGRYIRYSELNKVAREQGYTKIATAHNSDDNAETVLLNLVKGTGLRGISGIPVISGIIIRPVLVLTKVEILKYLSDKKILYRKDKSNLKSDYDRNYLRNKIIPLIKKLNPSLETAILNSSKNFRNHLNLFEQKVISQLNSLSETRGGILKLNIKMLSDKDESEKPDIIKLLLERNFVRKETYNHAIFNDVKKILSLLKKQTGTKISLSGNLSAAKERDEILIFQNIAEKAIPLRKIKAGEKVPVNGKTLLINPYAEIPERFSNNHLVEYISADNIEEQFTLRPWKAGDKFYPLGLKGSKKISDFLNEQKVISIDKKKQLVLTNGGKIVWVLGLRIDDRFKIINSTKRIFQLCLI